MPSLFYLCSVLRSLFSWKTLGSLLGAFGALWVIVEVLDFFNLFQSVAIWLKDAGWYFLGAGVVVSVARTWPKFSARANVAGQDVHVTVKIGDIFRTKAQLVIGTNTTFDTEIRSQLIAIESVQGQFTQRYFVDWKALDLQVEEQLRGRASEDLTDAREGKSKQYPIGETVKVYPEPKRAAYLVAMADLNAKGNASGTLEKLREALGGLWAFIREQGDHGKIAIPLLGTGKTRLPTPRREIIIEIVRSFLAACSEATFCKELIVVVRPADAAEYGIRMNDFQSFLEHECRYRPAKGTAGGVSSAGIGVD